MMTNTPNIVLLIMDTVRADHLSCYGYSRKTSPNVDEIAEDGILFENAFSAAPWTPSSHASIFTGKYPSFHKTIGKDVRFSKSNPCMSELLAKSSYYTLGITFCKLLGPGSGFERGFDKLIELSPPSISKFSFHNFIMRQYMRTLISGPDKGSYLAVEFAKKHLRKKHAKNRPFFLFINFFDAHTPYDPPRPFKRKFCPQLSRTRTYMEEFFLRRLLHRNTERISVPNLDVRRLRWIASGEGGFAFAAKQEAISEMEWKVIESWYDAEITYVDHMIGSLVNFLQEVDLIGNTLFIITSDHGENFGEHGLAVHPLCLYDSLLHVPLIISHPDLTPEKRRNASLVSTIDILPTLMEIVDIKFDGNVQGKSLYPFENKEIHDHICAEYGGLHTRGLHQRLNVSSELNKALEKIDTACKALRTLKYKYILTQKGEELYNIIKDPNEQTNIISEQPEKAATLREELEGTVDTSFFGPKDSEYDADEQRDIIERLKSLGYL